MFNFVNYTQEFIESRFQEVIYFNELNDTNVEMFKSVKANLVLKLVNKFILFDSDLLCLDNIAPPCKCVCVCVRSVQTACKCGQKRVWRGGRGWQKSE